jgi:hypothetical protein
LIQEAEAIGVSGVVIKPLVARDLAQALRRALDQS